MAIVIDYKKINYHDITEPKNGYIVYVDKYWICDEVPERALFYGTSPQCNSSKEVIERAGLFRTYDELKEKLNIRPKIIWMPIAYVVGNR